MTELGDLFYAPTVITGVTEEMDISEEEIFGPVVAINTFETEEEGVKKPAILHLARLLTSQPKTPLVFSV